MPALVRHRAARARLVAGVVVLVTLAILAPSRDGLSKKKPTPTPCPGGRFLLGGAAPLVVGAAAPEDAIVLETPAASRVSIGQSCASARARIKATKKGTSIHAQWARCGGARRVRLDATIRAGCSEMAGVVRAKGAKAKKFVAPRSRCGDDRRDAGALEQCDGAAGGCEPGSTCTTCSCVAPTTTTTTLPASVFDPANTWDPSGSAPPEDAVQVSPEDYQRFADGGYFPLVKRDMEERVAAEATRRQADRALVESMIAQHPELKPVQVTPPADAQPVGGDWEVPLQTPSGVRPVVLQGEETVYSERAAALRRFPARSNQERLYRSVYEMLPEDQRDGLPALDGLGEASDDALILLTAEVVRRAEDFLPNVAPPDGVGGGAGAGLHPRASGCDHVYNGMYENFTWPLKSYTTPVRDQAGRGTCAAHGIVAGMEAFFWKAQGKPMLDLSEQELYGHAKGRWFPSDYGDGLPTENAMEEMDERNFKLHGEGAWTYNPSWDRVEDDDDEKYTHSCDDYTQACSNTNHQQGKYCTSVGGSTFCYYQTQIEHTASQSATYQLGNLVSLWNGFEPENSLQNVRIHLAAGHPVVIGAQIDDFFRINDADHPYVNVINGDDIGGHAFVLTGYKSQAQVEEEIPSAPTAGSGHYYIAKNSWGCDWGDGGYGYLSTGWMIEHVHTATAVLGTSSAGLPTVSLTTSKAVVTSGGSVTLTANTGGAVTKVEFYEGFTKIGTDTTPPFTRSITYDAGDNATHFYFALAFDGGGTKAQSNVVQLKVDIDVTPPTVTLTPSSPTVATPPGNVTLTAAASDNKGVTKVEFYRRRAIPLSSGGGVWETLTKIGEDTTAPYTLALQYGLGDVGSHSFRAIASDAAGNRGKSQPTSVQVVGLLKPLIGTFTANPGNLPVGGGQTTLSWSVLGASTLSIDQGVGTVTGGTGSKIVTVTANTTFTLTATNAQGTSTAQVTVAVTPALKPFVTSFTATPATLTGPGQTTLAWNVLGADTVAIDQGVGDVTGLSQKVEIGRAHV